ncbi:PIN domain-containing protein [Candidatus Gottesmanbacteria bacterium]|nr:PIN domain-containing protein [Candidatus Gottesmanbacteria bacterium]
MSPRAFVDSDVIIASLLTPKGASAALLERSDCTFCISNVSRTELGIVAAELHIDKKRLVRTIAKQFFLVVLKQYISTIKQRYSQYVRDVDDAHIVAGARAGKVQFLVTYNQKHFRGEKIKHDLDIVVLTPALFLQYLRSRN